MPNLSPLHPVRLARQMLGRAARRFRRARPGSVLILVIALLVLMALIGTAFISSAHIDRYAATVNTYNTQIDLLLQGAEGTAQGPMLAKLKGLGNLYRSNGPPPWGNPPPPGFYVTFDSPATDTYLADRVPAAPGVWPHITAPPYGLTFEAPYAVDAGSKQPLPNLPVQYTARQNMVPTSILILQPDGSQKLYPAFNISDPLVNKGAATLVVAADTDGDGIADAGFVRVPMGQVEGATYYYAVRIIDNCAAINVNVAMRPMTAQPPANPRPNGSGVPGDFFPTNIDLFDLLAGNDPTSGYPKLQAWRFNNGPGPMSNGENYTPNPIDDAGNQRTDFAFTNSAEAAWFQLGMRPNYPGYNTAGARYRALPMAEAQTLIYHFCLANLNASQSPVVESSLADSTYGPNSLRAPYAPDQAALWFNNTFAYDTTGKAGMPLRPILVARNPVSNFVSDCFVDRGVWANGTAYGFGDRVIAPDKTPPGAAARGFVCIRPNSGVSPSGDTASPSTAYWAAMPWTNHPTKVNANTATFGQLWVAYWSVMREALPGNNQFRSPVRAGQGLTFGQVLQLRAALAAVNTIDMRDGDDDVTSRTIQLTPMASMGETGSPVFATVYGSEKQPYITELMIEYNPNSPDPTVPWVAIELYNPHPTTIPLDGWKLAKYTHPGTLSEVCDLHATLATVGSHPPSIAPGEKIVIQSDPTKTPQSLAQKWSASKFTPFTCKGISGDTIATAVVQQSEVVLLRPRRSAAQVQPLANHFPTDTDATMSPENAFDEGSNNPSDPNAPFKANLGYLVPCDQIDLVGVAPPGNGDTNPHRYRYARANKVASGPSSAAWHCVFPGPYQMNAQAGSIRQMGLFEVSAGAQGQPPADDGNLGAVKDKWGKTPPTPPPGVQAGDTYSKLATYDTRPIQINNRDSAGPNRPYADQSGGTVTEVTPNLGTACFPFGGFARNGDLLQVPFIGGYKLSTDNQGANIFEINSVTMDSALARFEVPSTNTPVATSYDADTSFGGDYPFHNEQIGHFCPMDVGATDMHDDPNDSANDPSQWKYHWAKRLFDYLAVYTPQDDYLPNVDPAMTPMPESGDPTLIPGKGNHNDMDAGNNQKYPVPPTPVPNGPTVTTVNQANNGQEEAAPVEGLINLNTAHWRVLSAVPFSSPLMNDPGYVATNAQLAQAITALRDQGGNNQPPVVFRSIFDLMKVPQFKTLNLMDAAGAGGGPGEVTNPGGDLSPFSPAMATPNGTALETDYTDHVYGDVKTRFLLLQRISNLVTTRSDSFTVYIQATGWQNVGSTTPNLVVQRRLAVLADRSQVKPVHNSSGTVTLTPMGQVIVPNN